MAEQEACASAVTEALGAAGEAPDTPDAPAAESDARGESLLLPLLQGLLGGGGERLLAGLGAAGADVLADVRRSLGRLRAALAPPAAHPQARALLSLADRLEDALDAADRLDGCKRRPRRRTRAARHTVGVTHEELEEARRMVDRDQLTMGAQPDRLESSGGTSSAISSAPSEEPPTPERQHSVEDEVILHGAVASRQRQPPIAHSVSYEPAPITRDIQVVERRPAAPKRPDFFRHSIADVQQPQPIPPALPRMDRRPSDTKSGIAAIANKFNTQIQKETPPVRRVPVNHQPTVAAPTIQQKPFVREDRLRAPLYKPLPPTYNFAAPPPAEEISKPLSRFNNNKRNRMKRANTIDIGKPFAGYRVDSDTDEENPQCGPVVPPFQPQTENDRKFVAFMQKNEQNGMVNGQTNWSNRFGNIKNTFENRERDDRSRSSSSSSAKRFWQTAEDPASAPRSVRKVLAEVHNTDIIKPPWVAERREPVRGYIPPKVHLPPPAPVVQSNHLPIPQSPNKPVAPPAPMYLPTHPPIPQSPTKPVGVKPFVAKPIPVNQFSHAPMSAFKPLKKIVSPTNAPSYVWSPPASANIISPTMDQAPSYSISPKPIAPSSPIHHPPWVAPENDKPRRTISLASKFEADKFSSRTVPPPSTPPRYNSNPPTPPTYAPPQIQSYPVKSIPSQNNLAAPELVKKIDNMRPTYEPPQQTYESSVPKYETPKIDAQKLQIEFYEKQIREKNRREANGYREPPAGRKPRASKPLPLQPTYTVTNYTPANLVSTFVPLQQTPDIEKARAHKVDYLPDVVMNEVNPYEYGASPIAPNTPESPYAQKSKTPYAQQNGEAAHTNGTEVATEHGSVQTRVMRGPVRGAATITAGVRTRGDEARRDSLRGVLDKISTPKRDAITHAERRKREARTQVRAPPALNGHSPLPAHAHAPPPSIEFAGAPFPRSPLAASHESLMSSESPARSPASCASSPLSKSGSWHQLAPTAPAPGPKASSPRRIVSRAKSMHLLAIPKLFEGGIARDELPEKKRTVEAYFSGQSASRSQSHAAHIKSRATRTQAPGGSFALGRSRTMPTVSELQFLDESNADDAFEDLVSGLA